MKGIIVKVKNKEREKFKEKRECCQFLSWHLEAFMIIICCKSNNIIKMKLASLLNLFSLIVNYWHFYLINKKYLNLN